MQVSLKFDGSKIVSASNDSTLRIWNAHGGECTAVLQGHRMAISALYMDSTRIISGSKDCSIRIWHFAAQPQPAARSDETPSSKPVARWAALRRRLAEHRHQAAYGLLGLLSLLLSVAVIALLLRLEPQAQGRAAAAALAV